MITKARAVFPAALFLFLASAAGADVTQTATDSIGPIEPSQQCAQLVKECFASSGVERSNCFFSRAKHPFCEGTKLGKLTYRRWIMSPVRANGPESPSEFLGPHLVDQHCLSNFDNTWLSTLIEPEFLADDIDKLETALKSCTKEISHQLTRP